MNYLRNWANHSIHHLIRHHDYKKQKSHARSSIRQTYELLSVQDHDLGEPHREGHKSAGILVGNRIGWRFDLRSRRTETLRIGRSIG